MSYILDALRKADAQRERDPSRGIHAQPLQPLPLQAQPDLGRRLWLWALALFALVVLLSWAGWSLMRPDAPVVTAKAPAPVVAARPEVPEVALPAPATELFPAAAPPVPAPAPVVREAARAPAVTAYPPVLPVSEPGRVLLFADLPADIQRDIPRLTITGGVYSPTPAQRLLIVNGLVLNEGAEAAPGVRLEQIRPKLAVLVYRSYRYGVPY